MTAAAVGLSHSPLIGRNDPDPEVLARVDRAVEEAREFIRAYDPELVVLYAPDHYNGFFYKEMPPFCLATEAHAVGDFGTSAGPLSVDTAAARALARGVLDRGVDLTVSARMTVDHGFAQPWRCCSAGSTRCPWCRSSSMAWPLRSVRSAGSGPRHRRRAAAAEIDRRVLFLASGGLSHDPPVPVLDGAPPRVAAALIEGRPPTPEQRARAEQRVVRAGRDYAAGSTEMIPINPDWDNRFLDHVENGELAAFDTWTVEGMAKEGGNSAHEVRTWIAAFASLAATGPYDLASRFYEAVPAWIAGFAVATAKGR
ncbi:3-carboxyethylcatechol 2,3-dioxygenase [Streptomyces sp. LBUM 1484]|nr:3-carboxyethylcatechol 2,3-dioxygenase [Streptomyces sp. LBUM 1484]